MPFVVKAEIQAEQAAPLQRDVKPEFVPQPEATVAQTPTTPTTPPTTPATPPPAATPTTPPSGGSDALPDNLGMGSGGCSDPMVQEMIALDNKDRAAGGAGPLQCDDTVCKLALEHSKSQCEYAVFIPPSCSSCVYFRISFSLCHSQQFPPENNNC